MESPMKICDNDHDEIVYDETRGKGDCPFCREKEVYETRLDRRDTEIHDLETRIKFLERKEAA